MTAEGTAGVEEVVEGPVTVRYPADAFPGGETPTVELMAGEDQFVSTFAVPGAEKFVADISAPAQPATAVQVTFDYDPSALPANTLPSIFYFDTELALWLSIPTEVDSEGGRLIGTTDHGVWGNGALS